MNDIILREARVEDAADLIAYVQELTGEPDSFLLTGPGEFQMSVEDEEAYIQDKAEAENSLAMLALSGSQIVGEVNLYAGPRKAEQHAAVLGISVRSGWRDQGLGTRLMTAALDYARNESSLKRIELRVFETNLAAIHLYKKFGFIIEGRRRKSIYKEGKYIDDLLMAVLLDD